MSGISVDNDKGGMTTPEHYEEKHIGSAEELEASSINDKAIVRKIDYRLVPWLSLLYLLSFLDRYASIYGSCCWISDTELPCNYTVPTSETPTYSA
jgi:hypothetical protein